MTSPLLELAELHELFAVVEQCCLHDPVWRPGEVASIVKWVGDHETGSDSQSLVLVRLEPRDATQVGEYGLFQQSEDYTGHGCQCDSITLRGVRVRDVLSGMDDYDILRLIGSDD